MSIFNVSIITLTKNDVEGLMRTALSVTKSSFEGTIEWLILDGSNNEEFLTNNKLISSLKVKKNIFLSHLNLSNLSIFGIYQSMDYGLEIAKGDSLLFMNGGDQFFENNSLSKLYKGIKNLHHRNSFSFGQAIIYRNKKLNWKFPHNNINNIKKWLNYSEPNHQTMLVKSNFAKCYKFSKFGDLYADEYWKRSIINNAEDFKYLKEATCIFYLDGISNKKLNFKQYLKEINSKHCSFSRKIIISIKYLMPNFIYSFYPIFQKIKNFVIGIIF